MFFYAMFLKRHSVSQVNISMYTHERYVYQAVAYSHKIYTFTLWKKWTPNEASWQAKVERILHFRKGLLCLCDNHDECSLFFLTVYLRFMEKTHVFASCYLTLSFSLSLYSFSLLHTHTHTTSNTVQHISPTT